MKNSKLEVKQLLADISRYTQLTDTYSIGTNVS